jgi:hypothetical protein
LMAPDGGGRFGELAVGQGGHPLAAFGRGHSGVYVRPTGVQVNNVFSLNSLVSSFTTKFFTETTL